MPASTAPCTITGLVTPKQKASGAMPFPLRSLNAQPAAMPPFAVGKKHTLPTMLTPSSLCPGLLINPVQRSRS